MNIQLASLYIITVLLCSSVSAEEAMVAVFVRSETVGGRIITVGDVGDVIGLDMALQRRVSSVPLVSLPKESEAVTMSRAEIAAAIEKRNSGVKVVLGGSNEIVIRNSCSVDIREHIYTYAKESLLNVIGSRVDVSELAVKGWHRKVCVPDKKFRLESRVHGSDIHRVMSVWVDVWVNERFSKTVRVWLTVKGTYDVLVATRTLEYGRVASAGDFRTERRSIAKVSGTAFDTRSSVEGKRITRTLEAGDVLTQDAVEELPMVYKGQKVAISVNIGRVRISAVGIALEDGDAGDVVLVRGWNGEELNGRVVGVGRVDALG